MRDCIQSIQTGSMVKTYVCVYLELPKADRVSVFIYVIDEGLKNQNTLKEKRYTLKQG